MTVTAKRADGWAGLFGAAFRESRNAMVLLDERRRLVGANGAYLRLLGHRRDAIIGRPFWEFVVGGPLATPRQWEAALSSERFSGEANMLCADGSQVAVQWGATVERVTGRRLVLFVAVNTSRWGRRFRRPVAAESTGATLSGRELEVVRLVALGSSGPEIADELRIAHDTVRTHVRNAMTKTGSRPRAPPVAQALRAGPPPPPCLSSSRARAAARPPAANAPGPAPP